MDNDNILISTGWYADQERHKNYNQRSQLTFASNWFCDYWMPYIERYINPGKYFIYSCECPVKPIFDKKDVNKIEIVYASRNASLLDHRHGFHAGVMLGLQYALCEGRDFLYIEQDCLVVGLDKVIDWARCNIHDKLIVYGWDPWWFHPGWAEQSLMFVPNYAIPTVLYLINNARVHENNMGIPEMNWHNLFQNCFVAWPFGYGRHQVTDWGQPMFYKQQVTDGEVEKFINLETKVRN